MADTTEVKHEHGRFFIEVENEFAELLYRTNDAGVLEMYRTFVPEIGRGKGLAQKLAVAALSFAREKGKKVKPACSFVDKFISTHDEYKDLLAH